MPANRADGAAIVTSRTRSVRSEGPGPADDDDDEEPEPADDDEEEPSVADVVSFVDAISRLQLPK